MYRIFLAEDDAALAEVMKKQLDSYGYETVTASSFEDISGEVEKCCPHLVLMDIMLPFRDGYYWCREIRQNSAVPIVFISSASDNMNIVMAINMGGDDFIAKPVDPMVLTAKVQAVLRRTYEMNDASRTDFADAYLNAADSTVVRGDKRIELTRNELRILQILLENKGKIVSRDALMMRLWQSDLYVEENTLTVNVGRLRKKLEENGLTDVIITKPGSGYMIP